MSWYLAPSLVRLRREVNAKWPKRSKRSDGTLGDARHRRTVSDHNPGPGGIVRAIDFDKDGIDVPYLTSQLKKHPSVQYYIWRRRIYDRANGFRPRYYGGANPHNEHIHVSVRHNQTGYRSTQKWLGSTPAPTPRARYAMPAWPFGTDHNRSFHPYMESKPPVYANIKHVQRKLYSLGYTVGPFDGMYGPTLKKAVVAFQKANGLSADGLVGYQTWTKLRSK